MNIMINVGEFLENVKEAQKTYNLNVTDATKLVEGINNGKYASTVLKEIKDSREKASKHTIGDKDSEVAFKIDSENGDITFNGGLKISESEGNADEDYEKFLNVIFDTVNKVEVLYKQFEKNSSRLFASQIEEEIKRQKGGR